jgi:hypothetical protein
MEDFSDATNRTIILLLFIIFIFYLKYVETTLKLKKNIKEIKCNPIQMIVGGIIDSETSNSTFEQCMRISNQDTITNYSSLHLTSQRNELNDNIKKLNSEISKNNKMNQKEKNELREQIKQSSINMRELANKQNEINNQLSQNMSSINTISSLAKVTMKELGNALNTFKQSTLMSNLM